MERITDKRIERKVKLMQDNGIDVGLDGAYGRFMVTNLSGSMNLSPRLPNREIYEWLFAYERGFYAGMAIARNAEREFEEVE